jgi:hypothetical protein
MAPMLIRNVRRLARVAHRLAAAPAAPAGVRTLRVLATGALRTPLLQRGAMMPTAALPMFLSARSASTFTATYNKLVAGPLPSPPPPPAPSDAPAHPRHPPRGSAHGPHGLEPARLQLDWIAVGWGFQLP